MSCRQDRAAHVSRLQALIQNIKHLKDQNIAHRHGDIYFPLFSKCFVSFITFFIWHWALFFQYFRIPWPQFKAYFMFKLEKVMDDFHASAPEQRGQHNPNVDYVPFEEMKERILKIVNGYNGWVKLVSLPHNRI